MTDVEAFIWHNADGKIVAVGHATAATKKYIEPVAQPGHKIIKVRLPEEDLASLHLTHSVDVKRGTLRAQKSQEGS